jgi:hypothetical protein
MYTHLSNIKNESDLFNIKNRIIIIVKFNKFLMVDIVREILRVARSIGFYIRFNSVTNNEVPLAVYKIGNSIIIVLSAKRGITLI